MAHPILDPNHVCQCPRCTPEAFPPEASAETRQGEGHCSVRFGKHDRMTNVYIDGVKSRRTFECMAGQDGWALVANEKHPHGCRTCGGDLCLSVVRGHIRLELWDGSSE